MACDDDTNNITRPTTISLTMWIQNSSSNNTMLFLSLLVFTLSAFPYYAYSYCIYNKHTDQTFMQVSKAPLWVRYQDEDFRKDIGPGGKECCPFTNSDCNPDPGNPDHIVKLYITRYDTTYSRFTVTLPAGGWVVLHGDKESYDVAVRWADGRNYDEAAIVKDESVGQS
ncbi:hypothetical protein BJV82DRAFT_578451 [Fennellomyces sp. T-0311]|nr:hypothetical protein BJV82DRAFT_578451 [Fennellomyces sp. T-0311]